MANELDNLYNRIFSAVYDPFMRSAEENVLGQKRNVLLRELTGSILEIGCGTGVNFRYYSENARVLALEPSRAMRERAQSRITEEKPKAQIELRDWFTHSPEFIEYARENNFDAVVFALVLCTIPEPAKLLVEIKNFIKPGGQLIALEHVKAKSEAGQLLQNLANPFWRHLAEGCQLNRDTHQTILQAGFTSIELSEFDYTLPFVAGRYKFA